MLKTIPFATILSFALASNALADGKCGDGHLSKPFEFSKNELITTWAVPVPRNAKVTFATSAPFDSTSKELGSEIPNGFPDKYIRNLKQIDIFNPSMEWSVQQLIDLEKRYGFIIDKSDDALPIFNSYADSKHDFMVVLAEHPPIQTGGAPYNLCSIVLQRAVIEYADGTETLSLRSYFHSATANGDYVNFVPRGGLELSFPSEQIWFPLSLSKVIPEPASYVVIDVLTQKPLDTTRLPPPFRAEPGVKEMTYNGKKVFATRVVGKVDSGKDLQDLTFKP
jgi:hypothetical protein